MFYSDFPQLIGAYLNEKLKDKPKRPVAVRVASQWISLLTETPTRTQLMERQEAKAHVPSQANSELALVRAACRWGLYKDRWNGGDPTAGIHKLKTRERWETVDQEHLKAIIQHWHTAATLTELRDRALFGIMLFTGCRPSEIRRAELDSIKPYGTMGCWRKPTTKTGEPHKIPVPSQVMGWLRAWMEVRSLVDGRGQNPFIFPGLGDQEPLAESSVRLRWARLCRLVGMVGAWNYDLRRTMANNLGNKLHYDIKTVRAVLNHHDGESDSHYYRVDFDALTTVVQHYAEWVFGLGVGSAGTSWNVPVRESCRNVTLTP